MGCDSHPHIEVYVDGHWRLADEKYRYYEAGARQRIPHYLEVLGDRSYVMFAVLADVRNRGSITPLFAGRGIPDDVSTEIGQIMEEDEDLHSHTFFTLKELQDIDWNAPGAFEDVAVFADDFLAWQETGEVSKPRVESSYVRSDYYVKRRDDSNRHVLDGNIVDPAFHREVSAEEMVLLLMSGDASKLVEKKINGSGWVKTGPWVEGRTYLSYGELVPRLRGSLRDMARLADDPRNVRVVIAFDN
ncbi:MAG: hypothetical protein AB7L09_02110 [Nitrospira sp.]